MTSVMGPRTLHPSPPAPKVRSRHACAPRTYLSDAERPLRLVERREVGVEGVGHGDLPVGVAKDGRPDADAVRLFNEDLRDVDLCGGRDGEMWNRVHRDEPVETFGPIHTHTYTHLHAPSQCAYAHAHTWAIPCMLAHTRTYQPTPSAHARMHG